MLGGEVFAPRRSEDIGKRIWIIQQFFQWRTLIGRSSIRRRAAQYHYTTLFHLAVGRTALRLEAPHYLVELEAVTSIGSEICI